MFIPTFVLHLHPTLRIRTFTGSPMASMTPLPIVISRSVAIHCPSVHAGNDGSALFRARGPGPMQHPDHIHNFCAKIPWSFSPVSPSPSLWMALKVRQNEKRQYGGLWLPPRSNWEYFHFVQFAQLQTRLH